jgi:hypothetical protein
MNRDDKQQIERGIELLKLCQRLQSEKDGIDRPEPSVVDQTKTLDEFARDIGSAITYMAALNKLMPMALRLETLGRKLDEEGKINVVVGADYAEAALGFVLAEHGLG